MYTYTQLSKTERMELAILYRKQYSVADIATELGRHRSTIYRELRRGQVAGVYDARKAHHKHYVNRKYSKYQGMRILQDVKLREYIETKLLDDQWSPEQIAGRLASEAGLVSVSSPTIYKYIRSVYGRQLEHELQLAKQKRAKKHQRKVTQLEDRVFIDDRPESVNARMQYGHWEGDFIVSGKDYGNTSLFVLHERVSRYTLVYKIAARNTQEVVDVLMRAVQTIGPFKSLTLDNDIAFRRHQYLTQVLESPIYFCHPYHSWEKGGVENANRLIRRYVPKGCDIATYSDEDIANVQHWLNHTPRKILRYRMAAEVLADYKRAATAAYVKEMIHA